jgi:hypothetical protein
MDAHIYNLGVRVLIYKEEGEFCAHALELDLLGYGKTENEAVSELSQAIGSQISFARFKNDDSLLSFPAAKEFYNRWEAAHAATLKREIFQEKSTAMAIKAVWIEIGDTLANAATTRFEAVGMSRA